MTCAELESRGDELLRKGEYGPAYEAYRSAIEEAEQGGVDLGGKLDVMAVMGQCAFLAGRFQESREAYRLCLRQIEAGTQPTPDPAIRAMALHGLGDLSVREGSFPEARRFYDLALQEYSRCEDWQHATEVLVSTADMDRVEGNRVTWRSAMDRTIAFARSHGLESLAAWQLIRKYNFLLDWDLNGETAALLESEVAKLGDVEPDVRVDALLLQAKYQDGLNAPRTARKLYQEALDLASQSAPTKLWAVQLAWAWSESVRGRLGDATAHAEAAVKIARDQGSPGKEQSALGTLIGLRIQNGEAAQLEKGEIEAGELISILRSQGDNDALFVTLTQRGLIHAGLNRWQDALNDAEAALAIAPAEQRERGLTSKSAALMKLGRVDEAVNVAGEILQILDARDTSLDANAWRDTQNHIEAVCQGAAVMSARLNRPGDALNWLERGKARLLRRELAAAERSPALGAGQQPVAPVIYFCIGQERAMALVRPAGASEPNIHWLDLTADRLKEILAPSQDDEHAVFGALPALSAALGPVLAEAAAGSGVLYIVPDPLLYRVPFAALSLAPGEQLIDRCAPVLTPSLGVLGACISGGGSTSRNCLVVSGPDPHLPLEEYAARIAALGWGDHTLLTGCPVSQFIEAAPHFDVLHLVCHGELFDPLHEPDPLAASRLTFADGPLTARKVLDIPGGIQASLVYLNACGSGQFRTQLRGEVAGFWRAFLVAGAGALVATLAWVNPECAQRLAESFYAEWLAGTTKAEALRRAQLKVRGETADPTCWALHTLIGDGS